MAVSEKRVIAKLIDELGRLDQDITRLKLAEKRAKVVRPELIHWLAPEPQETMSEHGRKFGVIVGEQSVVRTIVDMPAIFDVLGKDTFLDSCSFSLEQLDALLDPAQRALVLQEARTGGRRVKTFALKKSVAR